MRAAAAAAGGRALSALEAVLRATTADLSACGARFALVGGLAVSVRCEPRFTRDIDLAVALPSDARAEDLVRSLLGRGYRVVAQVEHDEVRRLATVRLISPLRPGPEGVVVDLLFASSGIETELVDAAEPVAVFPELILPVARTPHLLAMKVLASDERRPQDALDARALLSISTARELAEVETLLRSIEQRGFHRGKRLLAELAALRRSASP